MGTTVCFVLVEALGIGESGSGSGHVVADWLFVVLLALLAVRVFLGRADSETPAWMGKLQTASPGFALKLGLLLFIAMPTDILTMMTVGGYLSAHNESLVTALPFVLLTVLLVGSPLLVLLIMGRRAEANVTEAARLDEFELVDRQRDRHRVLPGDGAQGRPRRLDVRSPLIGCRAVGSRPPVRRARLARCRCGDCKSSRAVEGRLGSRTQGPTFRLPVLQGVLPIERSRVPADVVAGVTLAALGVPEVMGYTKIAGMPVITGLYTILIPIAVFALLGSSRHLVVGADSATAASWRLGSPAWRSPGLPTTRPSQGSWRSSRGGSCSWPG